MPADLYGTKLQNAGNTTAKVRWSFDAYRLPVWGDFYAKDGPGYTVWNRGFADPNPTDPVQSGWDEDAYYHIIRPIC